MGERTQYTPGTFSWADLSTTDQDAAKQFYASLFGWESEDMPVGDGTFYSMQKLDGKQVAAISTQPEQQREAGAPPAWNSYVTVESADAALARATELGGHAHTPAFDVLEAGRMGVLQDPQGAYVMAWEPRRHIGAALVNAPGALCWNELQATDLDGAAEFYRGLFGWSTSQMEGSEEPYLIIRNGDSSNGGLRPSSIPGAPPYWLVYFATQDIDAALGKVAELGGTQLAGPIDIGIAKLAVVQDPQGAVFALYAGQLEP